MLWCGQPLPRGTGSATASMRGNESQAALLLLLDFTHHGFCEMARRRVEHFASRARRSRLPLRAIRRDRQEGPWEDYEDSRRVDVRSRHLVSPMVSPTVGGWIASADST